MNEKSVSILFYVIIIGLLVSCRNSVTEPNNEEIIEEKPFVFSLKQIVEPSERVLWKPGESHDIKWSVTENLDVIKIVLLRKFKEVAVISETANNDGKYVWQVPSNLPGSHHYRIRISAPYNSSANSTSVEFEIQEASEGLPDL